MRAEPEAAKPKRKHKAAGEDVEDGRGKAAKTSTASAGPGAG